MCETVLDKYNSSDDGFDVELFHYLFLASGYIRHGWPADGLPNGQHELIAVVFNESKEIHG